MVFANLERSDQDDNRHQRDRQVDHRRKGYWCCRPHAHLVDDLSPLLHGEVHERAALISRHLRERQGTGETIMQVIVTIESQRPLHRWPPSHHAVGGPSENQQRHDHAWNDKGAKHISGDAQPFHGTEGEQHRDEHKGEPQKQGTQGVRETNTKGSPEHLGRSTSQLSGPSVIWVLV